MKINFFPALSMLYQSFKTISRMFVNFLTKSLAQQIFPQKILHFQCNLMSFCWLHSYTIHRSHHHRILYQNIYDEITNRLKWLLSVNNLLAVAKSAKVQNSFHYIVNFIIIIVLTTSSKCTHTQSMKWVFNCSYWTKVTSTVQMYAKKKKRCWAFQSQ